jgi:cell division protein FtsL
MRHHIIITAAILAITVSSLFHVKYEVQSLRKELSENYRQIEDERENLRVLKAEWTYLNHPDRLRLVAEEYLRMAPIQVAQVHSLGENAEYMIAAQRQEDPAAPSFRPTLASAQVAMQ